jgi:hypothetical protein
MVYNTNLNHLFLSDPTKQMSPFHLRTEKDPVSKTLYYQAFRIPDDGQSLKTQQL